MNDNRLDEMLDNYYHKQPPCTFYVKKTYRPKRPAFSSLLRVGAATMAVALVLTTIFFSRELFGKPNSFSIIVNAETATPDEVTPENTVSFSDDIAWEPVSISKDQLYATLGFNVKVEGNNIDTVTYTAHGAPFLILENFPDIIEGEMIESGVIEGESGVLYIGDLPPEELKNMMNDDDFSVYIQRGYLPYSSYTVDYNNQPMFHNTDYPEITDQSLLSPIGIEILTTKYTDDYSRKMLARFQELMDAGEALMKQLPASSDDTMDLPDEVGEYYDSAGRTMREIYDYVLDQISIDITAKYKDGTSETKTVKIISSYQYDTQTDNMPVTYSLQMITS